MAQDYSDDPELEPTEPARGNARDAMVSISAPLHTSKFVVGSIEVTRQPTRVQGGDLAEVRAAAASHGISLNEEEVE